MDEIKVELIAQIDETSIDFSNIAQTPLMAFRQYYYADEEVWQDYLTRHDLLVKWENFTHLNDLNGYINNFLKDMNEAIMDDISHFDAKLAGGFGNKTIGDELTLDDWEVVIYNISNLGTFDRDKLKSHFFNIKTPSLFDFREYIGDNLVFTNCRKAIANRDGKLRIVRSKKNAYYPTSTTKDIKGCNFITAMQTIDILSLVSANVNVVYHRNGLEVVQSKEEILKRENTFYKRLEDDDKQYGENEATKILNELRSLKEIEQEVNDEIQKDKNFKRGSLKPDSLNEQLYSSEVESPTLKPTTELTTTEEIEKEFDEEKEYLLIKKQKKDEFLYAKAVEVQEEALHLAYKLLNDGQSFKQINNVLNQKFAQNVFIAEIVNLHFSKQLKLSQIKDIQIDDLQDYISQIETKAEELNGQVANKVEEISKLRSTMQKKEIEHRNALETLDATVQEQSQIATEAMDTIEEMKKYKNDMDNVIIELDSENARLKDKNEALEKDITRLSRNNEKAENLQEQVNSLSVKLIQANEKIVELLHK